MTKSDYFNTYKVEPSYKDPETLKKFVTPRGKVLPRDKSNLTAKNQRKVTQQIKLARYMALMPFTSYQKERMHQFIKAA